MSKKIIPCLDVKDGRVVKGVHFVDFKDAGDPVTIAEYYNNQGADELVFLDITASVENRSTMISVVEKTAKVISIPLTVGGGIKSLDDIEKVINAGASKISINSAAIKSPELIEQAATKLGSSKVVVAIDVKKNELNKKSGYDVYINGGNLNTGKDALEWALEAERLGAGEILLTSMDRDGVKNGYDLDITGQIARAVKIPVVASGGAGKKEDFYDAFTKGNVAAALAASLFHFNEVNIMDLKKYLAEKGIDVKL